MIPFESVKVLVPGGHKLVGDKLIISSTVTLIKSDKIIIVDTGGFGKASAINERLAEEGLTPEQIDIVFLTHLHLDHIVNVHMFPNARVYCRFINGEYPGQFHIPSEGAAQRTDIQEGAQLTKGVTVVELPGHTSDMVGLLVETDNGKILVAGDSMSSEAQLKMENKPPGMVLWDGKEYDKSRKKAMQIADYIIPGHGDMFKVKK